MRYEPMVSEPERKTKKIAFCLHGIVGGVGGKYGEGDSLESLELGYKHYKKYILDINDCDVFCHTATLERSEDIINLYQKMPQIFEINKNIKHDGYISSLEKDKAYFNF